MKSWFCCSSPCLPPSNWLLLKKKVHIFRHFVINIKTFVVFFRTLISKKFTFCLFVFFSLSNPAPFISLPFKWLPKHLIENFVAAWQIDRCTLFWDCIFDLVLRYAELIYTTHKHKNTPWTPVSHMSCACGQSKPPDARKHSSRSLRPHILRKMIYTIYRVGRDSRARMSLLAF